jgi:hypothetical protein
MYCADNLLSRHMLCGVFVCSAACIKLHSTLRLDDIQCIHPQLCVVHDTRRMLISYSTSVDKLQHKCG